MGKPFQKNINTMKIQKTAYIIDAYSTGSYHEVINQGYLMMISDLYDNVVYLGTESSCKNLQRLMDECKQDYGNVKFNYIKKRKIKIKRQGLHSMLHLFQVSWLNYKYYKNVPKNSDVFFNNNLFYAIFLIHFFSRLLNNMYIMCHSEMEHIVPNRKENITSIPSALFFKFVFNNINLSEKFHFILLSSRMADYFKGYIKPENRKRIYCMDHCYIRPENKFRQDNIESGDWMKIGIPGAITPQRGLAELETMLETIHNERIRVYSLSYISKHISKPCFVELNKTGKLLPFNEYNNYVRQMDILSLLYTAGSYKLTASGAALEAIWNEKPIFAIKNDYLEYLFEKFGPLGYLANDVTELVEKCDTINYSSILKFIVNIQKAKKKLLPNSVELQLTQIINS